MALLPIYFKNKNPKTPPAIMATAINYKIAFGASLKYSLMIARILHKRQVKSQLKLIKSD